MTFLELLVYSSQLSYGFRQEEKDLIVLRGVFSAFSQLYELSFDNVKLIPYDIENWLINCHYDKTYTVIFE